MTNISKVNLQYNRPTAESVLRWDWLETVLCFGLGPITTKTKTSALWCRLRDILCIEL